MHKLFTLALAAQGFLIYFTVDASARAASPAFSRCENRCAGKYLPPLNSGYSNSGIQEVCQPLCSGLS